MATTTGTRMIRHAFRFRRVVAWDVERVTPNMVRVRFGGEDLDGFVSADPADHVKVFFPPSGTSSRTIPDLGPGGPHWPDGIERAPARDYTPRHYDPETGVLTIDFFIHGSGPGSTWADNARAGDVLGIGGPRGSVVLDEAFDWFLLVGDESALPTIGRRLEELPAGATCVAVIALADERDRQEPATPTDLDAHWVTVGDDATAAVLATLRGITLPDGSGYAWLSGETSMLRDVRRYLLADGGFDRSRLDVNGHWKRGTASFDHHAPIEE